MASLVACLMILLVVTGVVVNGIIGKLGLEDSCKDKRCLFKDPHLPTDITCVSDKDCSAWVHPCLIGYCSEEGTEKCVYSQAGLSQCLCKESYHGQTCHHRHQQEVDEEHCSVCFNNGTCLLREGGSGYLCLCTERWDGDLCQQRRIVPLNASSHECTMLSGMNWPNHTHWYELARTDLSYLPLDGCVTYDFSNSTHVNVTSVPLSKFTKQRQGKISWGMSFQETDGHFHVNGSQPFLHVSNSDDLIHVAISPITSTIVAMHMCSIDRLFGKQEFVTVLSQLENEENVDMALDKIREQLNGSNMTFIQTDHHLPGC